MRAARLARHVRQGGRFRRISGTTAESVRAERWELFRRRAEKSAAATPTFRGHGAEAPPQTAE
jgi:hypothetical protein